LGDHPASQQGAPDGSTAAGLPGRRSKHPRQSVRLRIGLFVSRPKGTRLPHPFGATPSSRCRACPILRNASIPRARFPRSPQAGSPMFYSLAARPSGPSAAALRSNELRASTWSGLPKSAGPRHASPRGFPPAACGAVAPRFAAAYAPHSRKTHAPTSTEPLFRSLYSLHRDSVNIRRLGRVQIKARLDPPASDPAPNLPPSPKATADRCAASPGALQRLIPLRFKIGVYAELIRITGKAGALRWAGALLRATNAASDSYGPVGGMRGLLEVAALPGQLRALARS
jgi:hypothetical protein